MEPAIDREHMAPIDCDLIKKKHTHTPSIPTESQGFSICGVVDQDSTMVLLYWPLLSVYYTHINTHQSHVAQPGVALKIQPKCPHVVEVPASVENHDQTNISVT